MLCWCWNWFYAPQAYIMDLLNPYGFSYCPWFAGKNRFSGTNIFYWSLGKNRFLVFPLILFFPATRVEYKNPHETISISLFWMCTDLIERGFIQFSPQIIKDHYRMTFLSSGFFKNWKYYRFKPFKLIQQSHLWTCLPTSLSVMWTCRFLVLFGGFSSFCADFLHFMPFCA